MPKSRLDLNEIAIKRIDHYPNQPTIIFLHDSLGCIDLWRYFPEKLGEMTKCNILIYDRQGYGKSCPFFANEREIDYLEKEAEILNELLHHWKIEKGILFGHSDGGSIALITAAKYPQKILGIITEGAHIFVEKITIQGIEEAVKLYQNTNLKTKLTKYHGNKTEEMFQAWAKTWTKKEFADWNIEKFLPSIKCDSLIIQGREDEYGTLAQVEGIIQNTSGKSEKLIITGVKHSPHKEVPELVLNKTTEFINKLAIILKTSENEEQKIAKNP